MCVCVHAWACIRSCKASKRIYVIRNLKRSGCDAQSIMRVYRQTIQSLLVYGHPCCCNMSQKCIETLMKIERRVMKVIFHGYKTCPENFVTLPHANERSCVNLFHSVLNSHNHPLRTFFLHTAAYSSQQVYFKEAQMSDRAFQKLFYQVLLGTTIPDS